MAQNQPTVTDSRIPGMSTQPVITVTTITSAASALIALAVYLWPGIDPNIEKAINAAIVALWPIVTAAWTWHRVYAPRSVEKIADEQYRAGKPPTDPQPEIPPPGQV